MKTRPPFVGRLFLFLAWPLIAPVILILLAALLVLAWFAILHPDFELELKA